MRFLNPKIAPPRNIEEIDKFLSRAVLRYNGVPPEHEVYQLIKRIGIDIPKLHYYDMGDDPSLLSDTLSHSKYYVAKVVLSGITHKTDIGGIIFDVDSNKAEEAVCIFAKRFEGEGSLKGVLFAEQLEHDSKLGGEMLIGLYQDEFFGPCLSLGFGGTGAEHYKSIMRPHEAQLFIPTEVDLDSIKHVLEELPVVKYLQGRVRGSSLKLGYEKILLLLKNFASLGRYYSYLNPGTNLIIDELEINPLVALDGRLVALDAVLCVKERGTTVNLNKPLHKIGNLLEPRSVAIIGASSKNPSNLSNIILQKFRDAGMTEKQINLIHPKEREIDGITCVKDFSEMLKLRGGKPVDCLVVGVPAKAASGMISEAFNLNVANSIQIISAGFGETAAGRTMQTNLELELNLLNNSPKIRPVVNGPNTLGNIYHNIDTLFTPRYKSSGTTKGISNVALICQSGAFMITRISDMAGFISPKVAISVGNQMDLSVTDFFEYLLDEKGIDTYGLYIEGLKIGEGMKLIRLIEHAQDIGKLTVVYKAGRSEAGRVAAKGHTAAMAGDYNMFTNLFWRSGALVAETVNEFNNLFMMTSFLAKGLGKIKKLPYRNIRVAALSNAGYEKCALADHLFAMSYHTMALAKYSDDTRDIIASVYDRYGISNIMDIQDILDLTPMIDDKGFEEIIRATLNDKGVDIGLYSIVPETVMLNTCEADKGHKENMFGDGSILNRIISIANDIDKPFVVSIESGPKYDAFARTLMDKGIMCFRSADTAARVLAKAIDAVRRDVI